MNGLTLLTELGVEYEGIDGGDEEDGCEVMDALQITLVGHDYLVLDTLEVHGQSET